MCICHYEFLISNKSNVPEDYNSAVFVLLYKKREMEIIKNYFPNNLLSLNVCIHKVLTTLF